MRPLDGDGRAVGGPGRESRQRRSSRGLDMIPCAVRAACHTTDYIVVNSVFLTPEAWKAEVTKMRSAFGAPIDDETAAEITAYLASNYAVTKKP
jgi:hypothetical protein